MINVSTNGYYDEFVKKTPQMPSMQQNKVNILVQINKVRKNIYTTRIKEKSYVREKDCRM